jgi:hypothetical protein
LGLPFDKEQDLYTTSYITRPRAALVLFFDIRRLDEAVLLPDLRAYCQEHADIMALSQDYYVLIVDIIGLLEVCP